MNVSPASPSEVDGSADDGPSYQLVGFGRNQTLDSPLHRQRGDSPRETDGWSLHAGRIDYCGKLHLVSMNASGAVVIGNGRPCDNLACPDCGPRQYDRLAEHYLPLVAALTVIHFASATEDVTTTRGHIRDRISQRARRSTQRGRTVEYVRLPVEHKRHLVFATTALPGRATPGIWAALSGRSAAGLIDRYLVPNGVENWPMASDNWHLVKRPRNEHSSDSTTFGSYLEPKADRRIAAAYDDFETLVGYRPRLGEPVKPEHVDTLKQILAAHFDDDDAAGLGDD